MSFQQEDITILNMNLSKEVTKYMKQKFTGKESELDRSTAIVWDVNTFLLEIKYG